MACGTKNCKDTVQVSSVPAWRDGGPRTLPKTAGTNLDWVFEKTHITLAVLGCQKAKRTEYIWVSDQILGVSRLFGWTGPNGVGLPTSARSTSPRGKWLGSTWTPLWGKTTGRWAASYTSSANPRGGSFPSCIASPGSPWLYRTNLRIINVLMI